MAISPANTARASRVALPSAHVFLLRSELQMTVARLMLMAPRPGTVFIYQGSRACGDAHVQRRDAIDKYLEPV